MAGERDIKTRRKKRRRMGEEAGEIRKGRIGAKATRKRKKKEGKRMRKKEGGKRRRKYVRRKALVN